VADVKVLLDSNICIYLLEGLSDAARDRLETFAHGEVAVSAVSSAEVMKGLVRSEREAREKADAFFSLMDVLPFDRAAAATYASLPFKRHSYDRLIAAHALSLDLPLVTNNESDFADVPHLRLDNWTKPA
jgi:tRNA(fMet)-specific endonuclease VapC